MELASATLSDLRLVFEFIELVMTALGAMEVFSLKFDPPNKIPCMLLSRDGAIEFDGIEASVLHFTSNTTDLVDLVCFSDRHGK
jgi:hypothetical protein